MSKRTRKIIAIIGVICMVSSVFPFMAILAEDPMPVDETEGGFGDHYPAGGQTVYIVEDEVDDGSGGTQTITSLYIESGGAGLQKDKDLHVSRQVSGVTTYDFTGYKIFGGTFASEGAVVEPFNGDTDIIMYSGTVDEIYGGGYGVGLNGDVNITIEGGTVGAVYGGGYRENVEGSAANSINIDITGGTVSEVYGGGNQGSVGNSVAPVSVNINVSNVSSLNSVYGGSYNGDLNGSPSINLVGCSVSGDVSGGSNGGTVSQGSDVIIDNTSVGGKVFGSDSTLNHESSLSLSGAAAITGAVVINSEITGTQKVTNGVNSFDVINSLTLSVTMIIPSDVELGVPVVTNAIAADLGKITFTDPGFTLIDSFEATSGNIGNIVLREKLEIPNISIDYVNETLTGFDSEINYSIWDVSESPETLIHEGGGLSTYDISEAWLENSKKISIVAMGDPQKTVQSNAKEISFSPRTVIAEGDLVGGEGTITFDASLSGKSLEYKESSATNWKNAPTIGSSGATLEYLPAGTYQVRTKASSSAFSGSIANVTVTAYESGSFAGELAKAQAEIDNIDYGTLTQLQYSSDEEIVEEVKKQIDGIANTYNKELQTLTAEIVGSSNPADWTEEGLRGNSANPQGTDATYSYTVKLTLVGKTLVDPQPEPQPDPPAYDETTLTVTTVSRTITLDATPYAGAAMDASKTAIEAETDFAFTQHNVTDEASAIDQVRIAIADDILPGASIAPDGIKIVEDTFVAAVEGSQDNKKGVAGSFKFTVELTSTQDPSIPHVTTAQMSARITPTEFTGLSDGEAVALAIEIIESIEGELAFPMVTANEPTDVEAEIAKRINAIPGMEETGIEMKVAGSISLPADYIPAVPGTEDNPDGDSRTFTYTAAIVKGSITVPQYAHNVCTVVATSYQEHSAREALRLAQEFIEKGIYTYEQLDVRTEEDAKIASVVQVNSLIATTGIEIVENDIQGTNFVAAIEGDEATPDGKNGEYDFKVDLEKDGEISTTSEVSAIIRAYALPGQSTAEILARAKTAAEAAAYDDTTQAANPDEGSAKVYVRDIAEDAINDTGVGVAVNTIAYASPIAGTQESPNGTDGSLSFTLTLERNGLEETTAEKTIMIAATKYGESVPEDPGVKPPVTEGGKTEVDIVVDPDTEGSESEVEVDPDEFKEAVDSAIEEAEKQETTPVVKVKVNTPAGATSANVILPVSELEKLAAVAGSTLIIESGLATMEFDHAALVEMAEQAGTHGATQIEIFVGKVDTTTLTEDQKTSIGDNQAYEIHVMANGNYITDFASGSVTVTLNDPGDMSNAESVTVFYAPPQGSPESFSTSHSATSGIVTFVTNHFSVFYVEILEEGEEPNPTPTPTPDPTESSDPTATSSDGSSGSGSGGTSGEDDPSSSDDPGGDPIPETGDKSMYIVLCIGLFTTGVILLIMAGARKITRDESDFAF